MIYNENAIETMARLGKESVDLVLTSPPYGEHVRDYGIGNAAYDFPEIARGITLILKRGGVCVWVVADETVNGGESGQSFREALAFMELGLTLHDTMIYSKSGFKNPSKGRYHQTFEYMFVFSKGKPKTFNPIMDRKNKYVGTHGGEKSFRGEYGMRYNIWHYSNGGNQTSKDKKAFRHPAPFPDKLAEDHIISWTKEGETVYDPMAGSGTTLVAAKKLGRKYIGSEINPDYVKIINERLK